MPVDLRKAYESAEFEIYKRLVKVGMSYVELTNAESQLAASVALKDMSTSLTDLEAYLKAVLTGWGQPPSHLIVSVNHRTSHQLDNLWVNLSHYYKRLLCAQNQAQKTQDLTAFYYLARELQELVAGADPAFYHRNAMTNQELSS